MRELIVDLFAGGGGASLGMQQALGIPVDIAINHDPSAIAMHRENHPGTRHYTADVFHVSPVAAVAGGRVGLLWASPDCTHFSRAKGGKPVKKEIRSLAWVVIRWAAQVRPRVIILENVPEFRSWGPLDEKNRPVWPKAGMTFNLWSNRLRGLGYEVEFRDLVAADYGAPTIRKRLFMIARCDGEPIVWPEPTHGKPGNSEGLPGYRAAAECIDWTLPCPSIFERKRPLVENTMRRIARGIRRYVIDAAEPFIVRTGHYSNITGKGDTFRGQSLFKPVATVCATNDKALVLPCLAKYHGAKGNEARGQRCDEPLKTADTQNRFALVSAFLGKYYGGAVGSSPSDPVGTVTAIDHNAIVAAHLTKFYGRSVGSDAGEPASSVSAKNHDAIVATHLTKFYGTNIGSDMRDPVPAVTATGWHIGEVRAFLLKYYGTATGQGLAGPMHTLTAKHRLGLVTVAGREYQIADIGLRMLQPRELARAQGFPDSYILTGTKTNQVAKIGNSVCPPIAKELVAANAKLAEVGGVKVG